MKMSMLKYEHPPTKSVTAVSITSHKTSSKYMWPCPLTPRSYSCFEAFVDIYPSNCAKYQPPPSKMKQKFELHPVRQIISVVDLDLCLCLEGHIGDLEVVNYMCCYLHIKNFKYEVSHSPTKMQNDFTRRIVRHIQSYLTFIFDPRSYRRSKTFFVIYTNQQP